MAYRWEWETGPRRPKYSWRTFDPRLGVLLQSRDEAIILSLCRCGLFHGIISGTASSLSRVLLACARLTLRSSTTESIRRPFREISRNAKTEFCFASTPDITESVVSLMTTHLSRRSFLILGCFPGRNYVWLNAQFYWASIGLSLGSKPPNPYGFRPVAAIDSIAPDTTVSISGLPPRRPLGASLT